MIVIAFTKLGEHGGLGDRILGIISCSLIAKNLNQPFYILWSVDDIRPYVDYENCDFEKQPAASLEIKNHHYVDKLIPSIGPEDFEPTKLHICRINQEYAHYFYRDKETYYTDILNEYKLLYSDIFKPTALVRQRIEALVSGKDTIVGIQIRAGDAHMVTNRGEGYDVFGSTIDEQLLSILNAIKNHIPYHSYHIFITSDYFPIYLLALKIWDESKLIYVNDIIQHIDRNPVSDDRSKIFIDSYLLSQNTSRLYISSFSNFGRIAALTAPHEEIYDIITNEKLDKRDLVSKTKITFL